MTRIHHESSALLASGGICIEGQQRLRFPFRLMVPPRLQAPSVRTPDYSVRWMLRGVLDWRLHADPSVSLEMHAVTTHRERGLAPSRRPGRSPPTAPVRPVRGRVTPLDGPRRVLRRRASRASVKEIRSGSTGLDYSFEKD